MSENQHDHQFSEEGTLADRPVPVAAVVVTYFPDPQFQDRLDRVMAQVDHVILVDDGSTEEQVLRRIADASVHVSHSSSARMIDAMRIDRLTMASRAIRPESNAGNLVLMVPIRQRVVPPHSRRPQRRLRPCVDGPP